MTHLPHLSEDERQQLADGSLDPDAQRALLEHVRDCPECAADVERIRSLMKRVAAAESPVPQAAIDEAWPSIRERIEQRKVVPMPVTGVVRTPARRRWMMGIAGIAAAGFVGLWLLRVNGGPATPSVEVADTGVALIAVVDSTHAYQEEAQSLLNHLEVVRATMRPEIARAFDKDLHTIDVAIAELQDAIRSDPANPALRRLLASSYRQKVDLLKRVTNAG
jgi:anti-sigma factor RsiW